MWPFMTYNDFLGTNLFCEKNICQSFKESAVSNNKQKMSVNASI